MPVFTTDRLALLDQAPQRSPEVALLAPRGDIAFAVVCGDEQVQIAVTGGTVRSFSGTDAVQPAFTLVAAPADWSAFFDRTGGIQHHRIQMMLLSGPLSGGVIPSVLSVDGDQLAFFAHQPLVVALLDSLRPTQEVAA